MALTSSVTLDRSLYLLEPRFPSPMNGDSKSTGLWGCSGSGPRAPAPPCSVGPWGVTSTRSRDTWRNGKQLFLTFLRLILLAEGNSKRRVRFSTTNRGNANDRDPAFIVKAGRRGRHACKQVCCALRRDRRGECQGYSAAVGSTGLRRLG